MVQWHRICFCGETPASASKPSLALGKSCKFYSPSEISSLLLFFKIDIVFYFKYLFLNPTLKSIHYPWNGKYVPYLPYFLSFPSCITFSFVSSLCFIINEIISSSAEKLQSVLTQAMSQWRSLVEKGTRDPQGQHSVDGSCIRAAPISTFHQGPSLQSPEAVPNLCMV